MTTSDNHEPELDSTKTTFVVQLLIWLLAFGNVALQQMIIVPGILRFHESAFDKACAIGCFACVAYIWLFCLYSEEINQYDRRHARAMRRYGYALQAITLIVLTAAAPAHTRITTSVACAVILGMFYASWYSWLQSRALPKEDQEQIDALIAEEEVLARKALEERQSRIHAARLEQIKAQYRNHTAAPADPAPEPMGEPPLRWQIPKGKHAPLVYFIENGNRIKIGTTTCLERRISDLSLRPGNIALLLPGDGRRERALHKQFARYRIGASEWFQNTGALADFVALKHAEATLAGKEG